MGTRVLTCQNGTLSEPQIAALGNEICDLVESGKKVVLVSSGAVGAGMSQLGLQSRPDDVSQLQAVAAIGQAHLINVYNQTIRERGFYAAQVLLTADDLNHRRRYLNVRNTLRNLLSMGTIPIINENDTVAVEELAATFGDNDHLAAMVTNLLQASLLVLLSDVEGLYDGPPEDPSSKMISQVDSIDEETTQLIRDRKSELSRGGMASKIAAAKSVTSAGENMIIANGRRERVLNEIFAGQTVGTLFLAKGKSVSPWKRWLSSSSAHLRGKILLDAGAVAAICSNGSSLLPIGVANIEGDFEKGDRVSICDDSGNEIARGLTNYNSKDVLKIRGLQTGKIAAALGNEGYDEIVHRDNLVVLQ